MEGLTVNIGNLTVLILAAGYGRRMGHFSRMVNKGLIPYKDRALISHIIEKFPTSTKFVIACGHLGNQVKDYVSTVHNDKNVVFVDIPNYAESDTGPATTIQYCAEHLEGAFLWLACDTLFDFNYQDKLDHDWIGVYPVDSSISQDYCWIRRNGERIVEVHNKEASASAVDAFIGLMYAKDGQYLSNLKKVRAKETYQGFADLDLKAYTVYKWLDFGTYEKWHDLVKDQPENSFPKPNEIFYKDNGKVVKYFSDVKNVTNRVIRAQVNPQCMPNNVQAVGNFLVHDWVEGDIVYNQVTPELFREMLVWCEKNIWIPAESKNSVDIKKAAESFYKTKTYERLQQFRIKYSDWTECTVVNGQTVKTIDEYLSDVNWNSIIENIDWRFVHGDLHFDNTIYDSVKKKFTGIDWRTDFAGNVYGDIYYDLAKMLGGIYLNYKSVKNNELVYEERSGAVIIKVPSVKDFSVYEQILKDWVQSHNLSWNKVKILVPLVYLNMSPLHEEPFDKFLIALSQLHFSRI